jgi:hypothetical protein
MTMTDETANVGANLASVRSQIARAAQEAGRDPGAVGLVAVSKTFGPDVIRLALDAGHRVFGENRVQEAETKWPALKAAYPDVVLHLIGPLQTNKVKNAVALFDVIETVDRDKLVTALAKEIDKQGRGPEVFVQVNTGEEEQKAGVAPDDTDALVETARAAGLDVVGLMCIPPFDEEPSLHFALLRQIAERNGLARLSMGMSGDFPVAIAFGATQVRIGSAIFGRRPAPHPSSSSG